MKTLELALGDRSYPIHIGGGLLARSDLLRPHVLGTRIAVVSNETVAPLYLERCVSGLGEYDPLPIVLPDGEQFKTLDTLEGVMTAMLSAHCDRRTTVFALGGGVVGDLAGFAAACYMRGVPFVQLPTTLLAQVDASVGGKTGVNHRLGKNMIGAFHQPRCVLIDTDTLDTLPDRELAAGLAEVIKYGLIRDPEFFTWVETNVERILRRDPEALAFAIHRSCRNKAEVVSADERETGARALLNLGHSFGHAIENGLGYGTWLHGEAVSAGIVMAAELSRRLGWLPAEDAERIAALLARAQLPVRAPAALEPEQLLGMMALDKKSEAGRQRLVLLKHIGEAVLSADFERDQVLHTLEHCRAEP